MKKSILAFSLMALGSLQLNAAPCMANQTLGSLGLLGCEFNNVSSGNTWSLTNFAFTGPAASGTAFGIAEADVNIAISTWGLGFQVTTSRANGLNFSVAQTQTLGFETSYRISGGLLMTGITQMGASINLPSGGNILANYNPGVFGDGLGGPPQATLNKYVQRLDSLGGTLASRIQQELIANYVDIAGGSTSNFYPPDTYLNLALIAPNSGVLVVVDKLEMRGGARNGGLAQVASYTNYFAPNATTPNNVIPEPMTFALMGAGLVGLAILRRRK